MKYITVRTQTQLKNALANLAPEEVILIEGDGTFYFRGSSSPTVEARESSSPTVVAVGSSSPRVVARESSSPRVEAWDSSSPRVEAWDSSSPTVEARESSSPTVVAWDSSSPRVVAWDSSSPTVVAVGSSSPRVEAWESSSPRGSVGKYAAVIASKSKRATLNIPGAVILTPPAITTAADWCDYYGVTVKRGIAILCKAVDDDYATEHSRRAGIFYTPGSKPEAPDWDGGLAECGGGLHFSPHPLLAMDFVRDATRFVACPVKLAEIVVHPSGHYPDKVKAPRVCGKVYEVDRDGQRLPP